MHRILPLLLLTAAPALAQVSPVIDRTDMPAPTTAQPVDTLRLSIAGPRLSAAAPPLTRRGANQTWNYAGLVPTSQRVERFVTVATAAANAPIYTFVFGSVLSGVNRATVASPQVLPLAAGGLLPITDTYQFFALSVASAASLDFRSVGYGASLAGTAVPVTYVSQAQQDIVYRFPLSFASTADSSNSYFTTPAATAAVGYLSQRRKRVNKPDAWGTLITPFGTFQTVRVVSKLIDHDSISVGGISQGFDLPVTREYKWLAKTHHVPVLTITTQVITGTEVITSVEYRDIYRRIVRLSTRDAATEAALAAYPNPSAVGTPLTLSLPAGSGPLTVSATDLVGRRLFQRSFDAPAGVLTLGAETFGSFRGVALLTVTTARGMATRRVVRN